MNRSASNRFTDYDDDDSSSYKFGTKFGNRFATSSQDPTEEYGKIQERIGVVENESLESTRRTLRMLNETEEIGVKTAEELVRQGEKLENIDGRLDDVDQTLNATQKNLNQIKSVFGGLKNKFFGGGAAAKPAEPKRNSTPATMSTSKSMSQMPSSTAASRSVGQHAVITGSDREKEINSNLDEMSLGLARLKNLAHDMSFELDRQNPIIDRLNEKTERTKTKIDDQNTQIQRVLK